MKKGVPHISKLQLTPELVAKVERTESDPDPEPGTSEVWTKYSALWLPTWLRNFVLKIYAPGLCHAMDVVLQLRPSEYGPGRFHPKAVSGDGCITVLILGPLEIGVIAYLGTVARQLDKFMNVYSVSVLTFRSSQCAFDHACSPTFGYC